MAVTPIETISDLLEQFDLEELRTIIHDQVSMKDNSTNIYVPDNFKPIYYKWNMIQNDSSISDEIREEADNRMESFCKIILSEIKEMFHLSFDEERIFENMKALPGITVCLYAVFVLDLRNNLIDVIDNYIFRNRNKIYNTLEELKLKKDASTVSNKKGLDLTYAVIASNIYDIGDMILDDIAQDPVSYFDYLDPDYYPKNSVKSLFEEEYVAGNFVEKIKEIFDTDFTFKSFVCFEVISSIKNSAK